MDTALAPLLGVPQDDPVALDEALAAVAGADADARQAYVTPITYAFASPATAGLYRVHGLDRHGESWSRFCKVLQHARHWPLLPMLPPAVQEEFAAEFPWRAELALWDELVVATMPAGLRAPRLHAVLDLGDDRLALWMEDVREDEQPWDLDRYAHAAQLLGRWNARSRAPEVLASSGYPTGYALRRYATNAVVDRGVNPLGSDELWGHPWLSGHADLRARLLVLADRIPALLDGLDDLEQSLPHGDASPQNLLVPAGDATGFVVIDLAFRCPLALGFDLGQLLVGLVHCSVMPAERLPEIAATVLAGYLDGLRVEGWAGADADVAWAFAVGTLLRSGFDGFRYDLLAGDPDDAAARRTFDERVLLARFLVDHAEAVGA
jgi:hypothetical protein